MTLAPPISPPPYTLRPGRRPLLVSVPHAGRSLPPDVATTMVDRARAVEDTDWHLDRLYAFAADLGASLLLPECSRYVVDLNRPPEDTPMYPGRNNTGLCPTRFFTGEPLYRDGQEPNAAEISRRVERYWRPYHEALATELARLRARHGHVVLFEAHSIKSEFPWLFEGTLPALNLGTVDGRSCAQSLREALVGRLGAQSEYDVAVDERFKGGYITRHYGQPSAGVHAVQLEMCWRCYMAETPPYELDPRRVARIEPLLRQLLTLLADWRPAPDEAAETGAGRR